MKANELMIGDWVWTSGHPVKIETILRTEVGYLKQYHKEFEFIDPIPLTEEILKANGFKFENISTIATSSTRLLDSATSIHFQFHTNYNGECFCRIMHCGAGSYVVEKMIAYVHEFQHALRLCGLNELADNFKVE